uniref:Palmitoyltransferase n=1 Tax=Albugo laibachii Nc14 TaxID=890382 RepID=F0WF30_9STRA|nr:palmitoyltransferase putative [Albugo laibachii Nc14]|eukprot:CCA19812.1 palmitoyltransferase putative [Albugo laibachii Nc14]
MESKSVSSAAVISVGLMLLETLTWLFLMQRDSSPTCTAIFIITSVLMFWSYMNTLTVSPHEAESEVQLHTYFKKDFMYDEEREDEKNGLTGKREATIRDELILEFKYCERCDQMKVYGMHHCSRCGVCIYLMDHHCPWTANCIGWKNKKFFILFLAYTSMSCMTFAFIDTPLAWNAEKDSHESPTLYYLRFMWFLAGFMGTVLGLYWCFHMWLLLNGKTTLDFMAKRSGEFGHLDLRSKIELYFGESVWSWLLPI